MSQVVIDAIDRKILKYLITNARIDRKSVV